MTIYMISKHRKILQETELSRANFDPQFVIRDTKTYSSIKTTIVAKKLF